MSNKMRGIAYYGGKSPLEGKSKWICGIMGYDQKLSYIEPFAGMLGILLSRPMVRVEIVNDTNRDLINWWICVRDKNEELARLVAMTPISRALFDEAWEVLQDYHDQIPEDGNLERALMFHIRCQESIQHSVVENKSWRVAYSPNKGCRDKWFGEEFFPLAERLKRVQIECRDAIEILERTSVENRCLIYCDPPYDLADVSPYGKNIINRTDLTSVLLRQTGKVAISGYGDEWDHLGWTRNEMNVHFSKMGMHSKDKGGKSRQRVEVLWTNFKSAQVSIFD